MSRFKLIDSVLYTGIDHLLQCSVSRLAVEMGFHVLTAVDIMAETVFFNITKQSSTLIDLTAVALLQHGVLMCLLVSEESSIQLISKFGGHHPLSSPVLVATVWWETTDLGLVKFP